MSLGMRVLRGPDWDQNEADGGEGHLGTVVGVKAEEGTAEVVWDNGQVTTCRVGKEGKHDLRILDNAQEGEEHSGYRCDGCNKSPILGMRWNCSICSPFDLCTLCYIRGLHDLSHDFSRMTRNGDTRVPVGRRSGARRVPLVGIFPGARVTRGRDWLAGDVDGGAGGVGTVVEVVSPESGSARNAVRVSWDSGQSLQHRLGLHGKVDLVLSKESPAAPPVYIDHLPVLDRIDVRGKKEKFKVGDKVVVEVDEDAFRQIQRQACGWTVGMKKWMGKVGVVKGISAKGDIDVDFGEKKWRISPVALAKTRSQFSVGDKVRLLDDLERVKKLQREHGGWVDEIQHYLGKVGRVRKISENGDVTVLFGEQRWHLNALCCQPVQEPSQTVPQENSGGRRGHGRQLAELQGTHLPSALAGRLEGGTSGYDPAQFNILFKAIVIGDVAKVKAAIDRHPAVLNQAVMTVTPLHLAAYNGETQVARHLVERGAELERRDQDEDTPLLVAVSRSCLPVAKVLLERGADVNAANEDGRTSLHKAAARGRADVCRLLLQHGASTNRRDVKGNTPPFVAMKKEDRSDVMEVLMTSPDFDLRARNRTSFTILHSTCFTGRPRCAEMIIKRDPSLVHEVMGSGGWLPVHIAATNGRTEILRMLIQAGSSVNRENDQTFTPLQVACVKGRAEAAQILVQSGADINAQDGDRMTALHRTLWFADSGENDREEMRVETAKTLIRLGARTDLLNRRGQTALEMAQPHIREQMLLFLKERGKQAEKTAISPKPQTPLTSTEFDNEALSNAAVAEKRQDVAMANTCLRCSQTEACVVFLPCADKIACLKCAHAYSTCPKCHKEITVKIDTAGNKLAAPS